jgi:hypothetical protein
MLFDLRSRGRRRTVQAVYLVLALVLGGGLVLFGVGNGNGVGGILNAFNGSGNGGVQSAFVSKQEQVAVRQTKLKPTDPVAWSALVKARYAAAAQGTNFDTATNNYTAAGRKVLGQATQAWERYLKLAKKPDASLAVLAARAYDATGSFKNEATTWEIVTAANPTVSTYFENLALAAWQAGETNLGDLASAKAVSVAPKATRFELKHTLSQLRTQALGAAASTATTTTPTTPAATTTTTPATTTTTPAATTKTKKPAAHSGKNKSKAKTHR